MDEKYDLVTADLNALYWQVEPWGDLATNPNVVACLNNTPTTEEELAWVKAVHALRSCARRIAGYKPPKKKDRVSALSAHDADEVMRDYVALLEPQLQIYEEQKDSTRLRLKPDPPKGMSVFAKNSSIFWQEVFASLLTGFSDPICGKCGTPLPPTPTGKPARSKFCSKCAWKVWWESKDPEERKKLERERKRHQRKGQ